MAMLAGRPHHAVGVRARDTGDEYLFYDPAGNNVHILNGTAREIYLLCDGSRSMDEVADEIASRYDIVPAEARRDVGDTVERLTRLGVLEVEPPTR